MFVLSEYKIPLLYLMIWVVDLEFEETDDDSDFRCIYESDN